jgi:site-specific DNA-methyltransferase (adenine-specific)
MFGLIKLDESLFKNHPKSILILKKKGEEDEILDHFLLVDLPPFSDQTAFNQALGKMESWFKKKEVDVQ